MCHDLQGVHKSYTCSCIVCVVLNDFETMMEECNAYNKVYECLTHLWNSILCQKVDFEMWYKRDCLKGDCLNCGVHNLIYPCEVSSEKLVK